jgi:hypothetical protein
MNAHYMIGIDCVTGRELVSQLLLLHRQQRSRNEPRANNRVVGILNTLREISNETGETLGFFAPAVHMFRQDASLELRSVPLDGSMPIR